MRHDKPVATIAQVRQRALLTALFNPVVLQRIDDFSLKYKPGSTMSLVDLFTWTHHAVYGDLLSGDISQAGEIHRSLQQWYARKLAQIALAPQTETPYDAQSLAHEDLLQLRDEVRQASRRAVWTR